MAKIYGGTTTTPINPNMFGGGESVPTSVIRMWQPNTEYKVDDVVVAILRERDIFDLEDTLPNRTIIAKCVIQHKSTNSFALNNYGFEDVWEILQETYAYYDALGNCIHNTYATKDELAEAIGQALEGDY